MARRYVICCLLPALLLLAVAVGAVLADRYLAHKSADTPEVAALEETVLKKSETGGFTPEQVRGVVTSAITLKRQSREVVGASGKLIGAFAPVIGLLALWVAVGGYYLYKRSN